MTSRAEAYSILAVDIGSCNTRAALFDVVEGQHRFVARGEVMTSLFGPDADVSVGVRQAIGRIEQICGRTIMSGHGPLVPERKDGRGVDLFVSTASVGGGLRLLVIASSATSPAYLSLKKAAAVGAHEVEVLLLDGLNGAVEARVASIAKVLLRFRPQVVFVVGQGSEAASSERLGQDIAGAISQVGYERLPIRYVGDAAAAESFAQGIRDQFDFSPLVLHDSSSVESVLAIEQELAELWRRCLVKEVTGYSKMSLWQSVSVERSSFGFGNSLRFLSSYLNTDVIGVDIGASSVGLFKVAGANGQMKLSSRLGVGRNVTNLMDTSTTKFEETPVAEVPSLSRWLPTDLPPEEVGTALLNKWARPWTRPETTEEALFERALGVESVRRLRAELGDQPHLFHCQDRSGLVVGSGALITNQNSYGRVALTLLDALEPAGVFELAVDRNSTLALLGAIGRVCPRAAAEVLSVDAVLRLGTCVACVGQGRPGSRAVTVELKRNGTSRKIEVPLGEIRIVPLPLGETFDVALKPGGGLDLGWGRGRPGKVAVEGRGLGLIVDARNRPLAGSVGGRHEEMRRWLESVGTQEDA